MCKINGGVALTDTSFYYGRRQGTIQAIQSIFILQLWLIYVFSVYIKLLYLSVVFHKSWVPTPSYMKAQPSLAPCDSYISNSNSLKKLSYSIHKIITLKISEILQRAFPPSLCLHTCALIFYFDEKTAAL